MWTTISKVGVVEGFIDLNGWYLINSVLKYSWHNFIDKFYIKIWLNIIGKWINIEF